MLLLLFLTLLLFLFLFFLLLKLLLLLSPPSPSPPPPPSPSPPSIPRLRPPSRTPFLLALSAPLLIPSAITQSTPSSNMRRSAGGREW